MKSPKEGRVVRPKYRKPQVAFLFAVLLFMPIFLSRKSSAVVVLDSEQYHAQLLGIS